MSSECHKFPSFPTLTSEHFCSEQLPTVDHNIMRSISVNQTSEPKIFNFEEEDLDYEEDGHNDRSLDEQGLRGTRSIDESASTSVRRRVYSEQQKSTMRDEIFSLFARIREEEVPLVRLKLRCDHLDTLNMFTGSRA